MTAREFYKSIGICPCCCKRKIKGNENSCAECREIYRKRNIRYRDKNRALINERVKELQNKRIGNGQ